MPSLYVMLRGVIGCFVRMLFPAHVVGKENLPDKGPYIIAAGPHRTELESVILAVYLNKHQIHFFAKEEYWASKARAWLMNRIGMLPVNRHDGRAAARQIDQGVAVLSGGGVVGGYPEGTRGADDYVHKGHTGTVRTALKAGNVPIIPVGMIGMRKLNLPGKRFPVRPGRCTIVIGKPIYPLLHGPDQKPSWPAGQIMDVVEGDSVLAVPVTSMHARFLTNWLMHEIARLSTAEYRDEYLRIGAAGGTARP